MSWYAKTLPVEVPPEGGGRSDLPWQSNCRDVMMMCRYAAGGPTCPGRSNLPMM